MSMQETQKVVNKFLQNFLIFFARKNLILFIFFYNNKLVNLKTNQKKIKKSGRRESNSRDPPWQGRAVKLSDLIQNCLSIDGNYTFSQLALYFLRFRKINHYFDDTFLLYRRTAFWMIYFSRQSGSRRKS